MACGLASWLSLPAAQAADTAGGGPAIEVSHSTARTSAPGPAANFVGGAQVEQLLTPHAPSRLSIGTVTFAPGARSSWHTHPVGQTLIVTAGLGRVQQWGQPVQVIRPGAVGWIPPGVKHWHGASATEGMTHLAIQETVDGRNVDWKEPVSADQYGREAVRGTP